MDGRLVPEYGAYERTSYMPQTIGYTADARFKGQMTKILAEDSSLNDEYNEFNRISLRIPNLYYHNPYMLLMAIRILGENNQFPTPSEFKSYVRKIRLESKVHADFLRYIRLINEIRK